jgi:hypothetical protein
MAEAELAGLATRCRATCSSSGGAYRVPENSVRKRGWHRTTDHGRLQAAARTTIAIAPNFTNPRMTAQRAAFTMAGDSFSPLDQEFPGLMSAKRLLKFLLTPSMKADAAAFLAASGLDAYSLFPDLQGLAVRRKDEMRKRFEIMTSRGARRLARGRASTNPAPVGNRWGTFGGMQAVASSQTATTTDVPHCVQRSA